VIVAYLLEAEFWVVIRIILKRVFIATSHHNIDRCWELHGKSFLSPRPAYLTHSAGSSTAYESNTLGTFVANL